MKKTLIFAILATAANWAQAQSIPAGTVSLGGNVGYSRSTSNNSSQSSTGISYSNKTTSSQFSFSPSAGYFVVDNLAIGINLGYNAYRDDYTMYSPSPGFALKELDPRTRLQIGAFAQYYKMLTEQFGFTGTLGAGYQNQQFQNFGGSNNQTVLTFKGDGYYAALTPGIVFFPVPKLGLSASIGSLGYSRFNYDYPQGTGITAPKDYESTFSDFGASFGLSQLQFGGTYYFGR